MAGIVEPFEIFPRHVVRCFAAPVLGCGVDGSATAVIRFLGALLSEEDLSGGVESMPLHRTEGIVLKNIDYSETSKIVTLLTPDRGKIAGLVKGAKRPRSRFGSSLEPITHIELLFYEKRDRPLRNVTQTDIIESFGSIKGDFDRLAYAGYFVELCDRFVQEGEESGDVFSFMLESLRLLCEWKGALELLATGFGLRFLALAGFAPVLDACAQCGSTSLRGKVRFCADEGGILCQNCTAPSMTELRPYHLQLLRNLSRIPMRRMEKARVNKNVLHETFDLVNAYASWRGDVRLKSPAFLKATLT